MVDDGTLSGNARFDENTTATVGKRSSHSIGWVGKHVKRRTDGWIKRLTTTSIGNDAVEDWSSIKNLQNKNEFNSSFDKS